MSAKYTCPNCGGAVKSLKDAKGNIGACSRCDMAVEMTDTAQKQREKDGAPTEPVDFGAESPQHTLPDDFFKELNPRADEVPTEAPDQAAAAEEAAAIQDVP